MTAADLLALSPIILLAITPVLVMLMLAFYRDHRFTAGVTLLGLAFTAASLFGASPVLPREVTPLFVVDPYALYYLGLIVFAGSAVAALAYSYLEMHEGHREEFYLLLLLAVLGCAVLTAAGHFVSFFLGIELLSVSLYALAGYNRHSDRSVEAGVKYLILAAVSTAFILFGMALVYADTGSLTFREIAARMPASGAHGLTLLSGIVLIIVGIGFKLAVVPFHLWTPDVYEGAPAPVAAFIATASKGAVFALVFRYLSQLDLYRYEALPVMLTIVAVSSMFAGNLLALLQSNVKRILAYSSISHLGYLLVTVLAAGPMANAAAAVYLAAYFMTTLGAFGVVTVLSDRTRDADRLDDYRGLAWTRPWLAGVLAAMLFSLAGMPLTAGFIGKFTVVAAGIGSTLWVLVIALVINSIIGLFYYLRIIVALFEQGGRRGPEAPETSRSGRFVLACLTVLLLGVGVFPGPLIEIVRITVLNMM